MPRILITAYALAVVLALTADAQLAQRLPDVDWERGKETRIDDAAAGTDGYFLVYVPTDYDVRERWPVVFYYHGLGGRPDTSCIRRIADGKNCIVVGMSYYAPGMEGYRFLETDDVRILLHVLATVKARLNVNEKRLYVAGFSKGGFYTCQMLRLQSDLLAGAIVLGAGSKDPEAPWPSLAGKEVFIGCGQQDPFLEMAKSAEKRLAALGATVTFEQWPEIGHSIGDIAGVRKWLFEQTVDRPLADRAPGGPAHPDAPVAPPGAQESSGSWMPWAAAAAVLAGLTAGVAVLARRQRRIGTPSAVAQSRAEDMGP